MKTERTDNELLNLWASGDVRAASELIDRHFAAVERFFRNKIWDGHEDLVQQTFTCCVEARSRFRAESSFRTYLFGIANNVLRRHLRTRARRPELVDWGEDSTADLRPGPTTQLRIANEHALLLVALRQVPLDYQVVLELHYWEDLTGAAIAKIVGVSEPTLRSRLLRGRQLLRQRMSELVESPAQRTALLRDLDEYEQSIPA